MIIAPPEYKQTPLTAQEAAQKATELMNTLYGDKHYLLNSTVETDEKGNKRIICRIQSHKGGDVKIFALGFEFLGYPADGEGFEYTDKNPVSYDDENWEGEF